MYKPLLVAAVLCSFVACSPKLSNGLSKADLSKDVEMVTSKGTMIIRLSDSTPLHRDNFLKLVKQRYYHGILFHRVIKGFMVQAGDPNSKQAKPGEQLGNGGPSYTIPAEIRPSLFHKKGAIAAARTGDGVNPQRASSGSQFYLVHGKVFNEGSLSMEEQTRLQGHIVPPAQRAVYTSVGGTPFLDTKYTVFGEVIGGLNVIDSIAAVQTGTGDRPIDDVRIISTKLVKRK